MTPTFLRIGLRTTFVMAALISSVHSRASGIETFGPLPGGRVGIIQGKALHCFQMTQDKWRRCRDWATLTLPEGTRRVLANERVISLVQANRIDYLDEDADLQGGPLALQPQWNPGQMVNGTYSTERETTILTPDQVLVRLPGDPDSNATLPLRCPEAQNARVFDLMGPNQWALIGPSGMRSVKLGREGSAIVCTRQPEQDWTPASTADEVAVIGLDMLGVRTGDRIRFLSYDKPTHAWIPAMRQGIGVAKGQLVPDLDLGRALLEPAPEAKTIEREVLPTHTELQSLIDRLVPERYAYAEPISRKFILVRAHAQPHAAESDSFGVLDAKGAVVLEPIYAHIEHFRRDRRFKVAVGNRDALRWGYANEKGHFVVPAIHEELRRTSNSEEGPAVLARLNGKWGYLDVVSGRMQVAPVYDSLMADSLLIDGYGEGALSAMQHDRWGIINTDGKPLTEFIYDHAAQAPGGWALKKGAETWLLQVDGKEAVDIKILPPPPSFGGIGVQLGLSQRQPRAMVVGTIPGSPADKAGLRAGDWIEAVNGRPLSKMSSQETLDAIKGPTGTSVSLTLWRDGRRQIIKMQRQVISLSRRRVSR